MDNICIDNIKKEAFEPIIDIMRFQIEQFTVHITNEILNLIYEKMMKWKESDQKIVIKWIRFVGLKSTADQQVVKNIKQIFPGILISTSWG